MFNRSMPPGIVIPVLVYDDLESAVSYLCNTFGFQERLRIGNHRSQLLFEGASVVVTVGRDDQGRPSHAHNSHSIMIQVADADALFDQVKAAGGQILGPPTDYPFGERQFSVQDPVGHVWTFSQSIADVDPAQWGGKLLIS